MYTDKFTLRAQAKLKLGEDFLDLPETPSYLEKIEYVGRIEDNQAFISYKYQSLILNEVAQNLAGKKYSKNMFLFKFQETRL